MENLMNTHNFKNLLNQRGKKTFGYGGWGIVLESKDPEFVIKIFNSDECYMNFLSLVAKNSNIHFPRIKQVYLIEHGPYKGLRFVKIEKLNKINLNLYKSDLGFHSYITTKITRHLYSMNLSWDIAIWNQNYPKGKEVQMVKKKADAWAKRNPEFAKAINLIAEGTKVNCCDDLHPANIMQRDDGTWVIIDPYSNKYA